MVSILVWRQAFFPLTTIISPVASRNCYRRGMGLGAGFKKEGPLWRWESGKPGFGFPLFQPLRRRPGGNVGIAQRFPRTVESGLCFPSVRHFHRQSLFGRGFGFRFLGLLNSVARDVQLEDDAVVH